MRANGVKRPAETAHTLFFAIVGPVGLAGRVGPSSRKTRHGAGSPGVAANGHRVICRKKMRGFQKKLLKNKKKVIL